MANESPTGEMTPDEPVQPLEAPSSESQPSDTRPPRVWTVLTTLFLALLLAVFFQAAVSSVLVAIELSSGTRPDQLTEKLVDQMVRPYVFLMMLGAGQLGFAIATLIAVRWSPEPFRQRVAWLEPRPSWHVYPMTMLGSIAVLAIGLASAIAVAKVLPADETFDKFFDLLTIDSAIVFVAVIGIVPGVVEELLFRGYMQQRLVKRWGAVAGIIVTSILFGLVHGSPHAIAAALPLGFWFGYVAWRSGSIWPTILCHLFVNSGLNAWRVIVKFGEISESVQTAVAVLAVGVGGVCFAICCWPRFWNEPESQSAP